MDLEKRKEIIKAAQGAVPLDTRLSNIQLVNVHTGTVELACLGVKHGRVVCLDAGEFKADIEIDGGGRFALPGFLDTHIHLDSTLLTPENLAELIVPHGTTSVLADPMEISNVAGMAGLQALLDSQERLPYRILLEVPSRVPNSPGLETTGGELGLAEVEKVLEWPWTVSLGEMDPGKILDLKDEYLAKLEKALDLGKICNGHAIGLHGNDLAAYACGGPADDHECVDFSDALERLRLGMAVLVREGSTERNLKPILKGALDNGLDLDQLMFCTDDKHPDDIHREGHIDWMVNTAISMGAPPIRAIQMATINSARHFRIDHLVGSLAPGRWADILLTSSLEPVCVEEVIFKGRQVVSGGQLVGGLIQGNYPDFLFHTVRPLRGKRGEDFILHAPGNKAKVWVIELFGDQIINRRGIASLPVAGGAVQTDLGDDILKLAVVERYGKNGGIGITFVKGFGLQRGAIGSSVSHDHHNIVIVGTNDDDMAVCVRAIEENQGGLVAACDGRVVEFLPLPIGGLLSTLPASKVIQNLERLNTAVRSMGGKLPAPFMTLSFISLPTVPELGLTDKGLVDVLNHCLISPFTE